MGTCETCKHRGNEPIEAYRYDSETLEDIETPITYYECKRAAHDKRRDYKEGQKALVVDGSGYHAMLCVENTFGCNQWEAK